MHVFRFRCVAGAFLCVYVSCILPYVTLRSFLGGNCHAVGFTHTDLLLATDKPEREREHRNDKDHAERSETEQEHQDDDDNKNVPRLH